MVRTFPSGKPAPLPIYEHPSDLGLGRPIPSIPQADSAQIPVGYILGDRPDPTAYWRRTMEIHSKDLTLSELFGRSHEQYIIPAYQRRYSWRAQEVEELFDDVKNLQEGETHLLGNILCITSNYRYGINRLELVDGQQRITSLSILLKVLQDRFKKIGDTKRVDEIDVYLACEGNNRKPDNKLLLGRLDDSDYRAVLLQKNLKDVKNANLKKAYTHLKKLASALTDEELDDFHWKFTHQILSIRLEVSNVREAYRLFETINNRGLKLTSTDIIKNFLLGHASTTDEDTLDQVRSNWENIIVTLDRVDTDEFFRTHMMGIKKEKIAKKSLTKVFKKYYCETVRGGEELPEYSGESHSESIADEKETAVEFSEQLRKSALIYGKIRNAGFHDSDINRHLLNLACMKAIQADVLLLQVFQRSPELEKREIIRLLKTLEALMLRRNICNESANELEKLFPKWVEIVESDNMVANVQEQLRKYFPSDDDFQEKFSTVGFKSTNPAKYILGRIERDLKPDHGEFDISEEVQLEHIIPRTPRTSKSKRKIGNRKSYPGKGSGHHTDPVHRIGNLTLIASKLNSAASNKPVDEKWEEYRKSNFELTQQVSEYEPFNYDAVERRSKDLAERAVKIWTLDGI